METQTGKSKIKRQSETASKSSFRIYMVLTRNGCGHWQSSLLSSSNQQKYKFTFKKLNITMICHHHDSESHGTRVLSLCKQFWPRELAQQIVGRGLDHSCFCLFDLILHIPVNTFVLCRDGSSCFEPVLSKDLCVLLKDTMQWRWWDSNPHRNSLVSSQALDTA